MRASSSSEPCRTGPLNHLWADRTYHYACTTGSYKHPKLFGRGVFTIRS